MVRVAYYINQAPCTIRALLASLRVAGKSWSLLAHGARAGLMLWIMKLAQTGVESEEYHLLMFCALGFADIFHASLRSARTIGVSPFF